ncbi:sperm motility kinase-like [Thomomys bottae]
MLGALEEGRERQGPQARSSEEELLRAQYRVLRDIGEGGFSEVKLAQHLLTQTLVAVKVIPKAMHGDLIHTEIDLLSSLDHPNVIKLYEIIETADTVFMVMENAEGGDLLDLIQTVGCLWEEEARFVFRQVARAVRYCHARGIVHGDLKPQNILLDAEGNAKICDFGLGSRVCAGQKLLAAGGTLPFCAPELLQCGGYDGLKADVWSLGVLLYATVVGRFPFRGDTVVQVVKEMLQGEFGFPAHVSGDFRDLIRAMVAVDPERRPSLEHVLEHPWLQEGQPEPPEPQGLPPRPDLSILDAMAVMGYDPQQVQEALSARSYNGLMGTYLMLEQQKTEWVERGGHVRKLSPALAPCPSCTGTSCLHVPTARASAPTRRPSSFSGEEHQGSLRTLYLATSVGVLPTRSPSAGPAPAPGAGVETEDSRPQQGAAAAAAPDSLPAEPSSVPVRSRRVWTRLGRCLTWIQGLCSCWPFGRTERGNKVVPTERQGSAEMLQSR